MPTAESKIAQVNHVHIDGLQNTRKWFISELVKPILRAGNYKDILQAINKVEGSLHLCGIFNTISYTIQPITNNANCSMYDVIFTVTEVEPEPWLKTVVGRANTASLACGVGHPNFFGRGDRVAVEYQQGLNTPSSSRFAFSTPVPTNPNIRFGLGGLRTGEVNKGASFRLHDDLLYGDMTLTTWLGQHTLRLEKMTRYFNPLDAATPPGVRAQQGCSNRNVIRHIFSRTTQDCPHLPTKGHSITVDQSINGQPDTGFIKMVFQGHRWSQPLMNRFGSSIVMQHSLAGGLITTFKDDKYVPLADRFMLGGPLQVAGFRSSCVRPTEPDGSAVGGLAFALASLRFLAPLPGSFVPQIIADNTRCHLTMSMANTFDKTSSVNGIWDWLGQIANQKTLVDCTRLSVSTGLVVRIKNMFRLEFSLALPFGGVQSGDKFDSTLTFGFSANYDM